MEGNDSCHDSRVSRRTAQSIRDLRDECPWVRLPHDPELHLQAWPVRDHLLCSWPGWQRTLPRSLPRTNLYANAQWRTDGSQKVMVYEEIPEEARQYMAALHQHHDHPLVQRHFHQVTWLCPSCAGSWACRVLRAGVPGRATGRADLAGWAGQLGSRPLAPSIACGRGDHVSTVAGIPELFPGGRRQPFFAFGFGPVVSEHAVLTPGDSTARSRLFCENRPAQMQPILRRVVHVHIAGIWRC